jgi:hypothetical protein
VAAAGGAGATPGQLGALLSPALVLALGRARVRLRGAATSWRRVRGSTGAVALAVALALSASWAVPAPAAANHIPFAVGEVLAGVGAGKINRYTPAGVLIEQLDTGSGSNEQTGMCFDGALTLYSTNFTANTMSKFNSLGGLLQHPFGSGFNTSPESCVVDAAGNIYAGQANGSGDVLKFSPSGALLASFNPATEDRGTDWIDLAADQCTLFYTSEGFKVKRFNVCTNTQLADFATLPNRPAFALRIRPSGEVIVAATTAVHRLSPAGAVIQSYSGSTSGCGATVLFALNLDPDGATFWTGDLPTGRICRFNIATGALVSAFTATIVGGSMAGLAIVGEPTVSAPSPAPGPGPAPSPGAISSTKPC